MHGRSKLFISFINVGTSNLYFLRYITQAFARLPHKIKQYFPDLFSVAILYNTLFNLSRTYK